GELQPERQPGGEPDQRGQLRRGGVAVQHQLHGEQRGRNARDREGNGDDHADGGGSGPDLQRGGQDRRLQHHARDGDRRDGELQPERQPGGEPDQRGQLRRGGVAVQHQLHGEQRGRNARDREGNGDDHADGGGSGPDLQRGGQDRRLQRHA